MCMCIAKGVTAMRHPLTLGQQIGYWTIIGFPDDKPEHKHKICCRCVCGTVRWIYRQYNGPVNSDQY